MLDQNGDTAFHGRCIGCATTLDFEGNVEKGIKAIIEQLRELPRFDLVRLFCEHYDGGLDVPNLLVRAHRARPQHVAGAFACGRIAHGPENERERESDDSHTLPLTNESPDRSQAAGPDGPPDFAGLVKPLIPTPELTEAEIAERTAAQRRQLQLRMRQGGSMSGPEIEGRIWHEPVWSDHTLSGALCKIRLEQARRASGLVPHPGQAATQLPGVQATNQQGPGGSMTLAHRRRTECRTTKETSLPATVAAMLRLLGMMPTVGTSERVRSPRRTHGPIARVLPPRPTCWRRSRMR